MSPSKMSSQKDGDASLAPAPNQSCSLGYVKSIEDELANFFWQREMKFIEDNNLSQKRLIIKLMDEHSYVQKRLSEQNRDAILTILKMSRNKKTNSALTASAIGNLASSTSSSTIPASIQLNKNRIINLNDSSANPLVPFKSSRSRRGAMEILNILCSEKEPFSEKDCNWRGLKDQYNEHLLKKHNLKPHRCCAKGCGMSFFYKETLKKHTSRKHGGRVHCFRCTTISTNYDRLVQHFKRTHEKGFFQCSKGGSTDVSGCTEVFTTRKDVDNHRNRCHKKSPPGCAPKATASSNNMATRSQTNTSVASVPRNHSKASSAFTALNSKVRAPNGR